ncbi:S-layer homology domain-containing protein [Nodularia harveyana UHCC-0300]|uniref:S-layer homology domain-containing protein n=1 Tax=Nodularia harveyana UHCC-0300 TaxID=2974287 RepID=A0ABU5UKW1_9CYAN|nr:S-layer homology domain-containing protein [Nodularia harveyana]MEA5583581.1 S-layer homology domain-containing protein [Nodularia harveyana UHCC-0300]
MRKFLGAFSLIILLPNLTFSFARALEPNVNMQSEAIQQVITAKLMTNAPDGNFYPERMINRAELATIMVKAFNLTQRQAVTEQELKIVPDVPPSHWAFNDIQVVLKTDIMKGYRGNLFFPNQRVTRAEGLAIFAQAYGVFQFGDDTVNEILAPHPDAASIPVWARRAIATVVAEEFINTDAENNISPLQPMTRGDMAYVLSQYLQRQQPQAETPVVGNGE